MSSAGPSSQWTEHRNPQGRVYWYHQAEKRSVWEKPNELKTARERALDSTPWKEYQSGDRKYYVHSVTKESHWTLPAELKTLFDALSEDGGSAAHQLTDSAARGSSSPYNSAAPLMRPVYSGPPPGFASPNGSSSPAPQQAVSATPLPPAAPTPASIRAPPTGLAATIPTGPRGPANGISGGEEAFLQLLRDKRIDGTWTWEATMREIITEPLYKALGTLAERKAAFAKHVRSLAAEAEAAKRERAKAIEPSVRATMETAMGPNRDARIQPWLSYEGMLLRCPDASTWRQLEAVDDKVARQLWETMRGELREAEEERKRELKSRNKDVFMKLLTSFEADVTTRWKDARQTVLESDEWRSDAELRQIGVPDMISVFDDVIRSIEKQKTKELQDAAAQRKRSARQRRDWLRGVLQEGKQQGWLTVRTTFGEVYERLRGDDKMQAMLGQPGSSPAELFYDALDQLDVEMGKVLRAVEKKLRACKPAAFRVTPSTEFDDFKTALKEAIAQEADADTERLADKTDEELRLVFDELVQLGKEEARRIERKLRHLGEDLRFALKKVAYHDPQLFEPEDALAQSWEEVWKPKVRELQLREWDAFERTSFPIAPEQIEEARLAAWQRFVQRQKEKMAERKARAASAEAAGGDAVAAPRKRRERHERRSGILDEPSSTTAKRPRRESATSERDQISSTRSVGGGAVGDEDMYDSEKEEGEV